MDVDGTRRRATVACDYCRQRKRRCDGERPTCSLCRSTRRTCQYSDTEARRSDRQSHDNDLAQRVNHLESLVDSHSGALARISAQLTVTSPYVGQYGSSVYTPVQIRDATLPATSHVDAPSPAMIIPMGHLTTVGTLMALPVMQDLVGVFEQDHLTRTEARRVVPLELSLQIWQKPLAQWPSVRLDVAEQLTEAYFSTVHPEHPVLDRARFSDVFQRCCDNAFEPSLESALCLVVIALGKVAESTPQAIELAEDNWAPGAWLFRPAVQHLIDCSMTSFGADELLPAALYLCAVYFSYLARPFQAWRLVHFASVQWQQVHWLLFKNDVQTCHDKGRASAFTCTLWAIFVLESNLLAEHHLPKSGTEHIVEDMPLPLCEHTLWLSEISIRRLLNRVHYTMYEAGTASKSTSGLPSAHIVTELLRQVDEWYDMLPLNVKPMLDEDLYSAEPAQLPILLRYYSAREVICRPFLLYTCAALSDNVADNILDMAQTCLHNASKYLQTASEYLKKSSASAEIVMQSTFAVAIVLTVAFRNPHPAFHVTKIYEQQSTAIRALQRWAFSGSCIESMLWILQSARHKTMAAH